MGDRNLTDSDVEAIVTVLKEQVYADFKIEVANGILGWVKKAFIVMLILLAIQGMSHDKAFLRGIVEAKGAP